MTGAMNEKTVRTDNKQYLGGFEAWALAFGCSVGWGAFVMPGTTFLPLAGPVGTVVAMAVGAIIMIIIRVDRMDMARQL